MYSCTPLLAMNLEVGHPSVLVRAVRRKPAGALGVDERIVVVQVGQQSGAGLHAIFAGQTEIGERRAVLGIVLASPLQCILQRDRERSSAALGGGRALSSVSRMSPVQNLSTASRRTKMGSMLFARRPIVGRHFCTASRLF